MTTPAPGRVGKIGTSGGITMFMAPTAASGPWGTIVGADGNLWFAESDGNAIARITTSGAITEYPLPNAASSPHYMTAGPGGTVWFTEFDGNRVGRLTPP